MFEQDLVLRDRTPILVVVEMALLEMSGDDVTLEPLVEVDNGQGTAVSGTLNMIDRMVAVQIVRTVATLVKLVNTVTIKTRVFGSATCPRWANHQQTWWAFDGSCCFSSTNSKSK